MAVSIPPQFSFEMLSRLPPQSFVLEYKEFRPDVEPNGGQYAINTESRLAIHLRGASNEFALNSGIALQGSVSATVDLSATNVTDPATIGGLRTLIGTEINASWRRGPTWITASRESFNSGALPYLDNQDKSLHLVYNNLRSKLAKRHLRSDYSVEDLNSAGYQNTSKGLNYKYQVAGAIYQDLSKPYDFNIPLGFYSGLVNTHSVIPLGLMSSYSVNGWSVEVTLANLTEKDSAGNFMHFKKPNGGGFSTVPNNAGTPAVIPVAISSGVNDMYRDIRIMVPIVKILDPSVMQAIMNLYEKTETVNVGGMSFPMSLRLNSIGYRFYQFPLRKDQGDYYFRLPSTDRSVRGIAWTITDRTVGNCDRTDVGGVNSLAVTRLITKVGTNDIHSVVEDRTPYTSNVAQFSNLNERRSGAVFSPFPYWQDAIRHKGHQGDVYKSANWCPWYIVDNHQYGVVSFENVDHREPDYSGSFQASGLDLTNVGAVELEMRVAHIDETEPPQAGNTANPNKKPVNYLSGPKEDNYVITFKLAYDNIHEISPSGVIDITKAVL